MNLLRKLLTVPVCMLILCGVSRASDFLIELRADGEFLEEIGLTIEDDRATATVMGEAEQFNLKEMSWLNEDTGKWVTLGQCKAWTEASQAKSRQSIDSAPRQVRAFLLWSLDPQFAVEKSNGALRLTSGQVDYVIEGIASRTGTDAYFRYSVLNSYKKAMTLRKLPPYSELKAIEQMRALGIVPQRISMTIPGIPGSPAIKITIRAVD